MIAGRGSGLGDPGVEIRQISVEFVGHALHTVFRDRAEQGDTGIAPRLATGHRDAGERLGLTSARG